MSVQVRAVRHDKCMLENGNPEHFLANLEVHSARCDGVTVDLLNLLRDKHEQNVRKVRAILERHSYVGKWEAL